MPVTDVILAVRFAVMRVDSALQTKFAPHTFVPTPTPATAIVDRLPAFCAALIN